MKATNNTYNDKLNFIYAIKCLAIIMVLFNHTYAYWGALNIEGGYLFIIRAFLALACKAGVPLFFMCSGILLLKKEETFIVLLKHRIVRILCVMVIFAGVYTINDFSLINYYYALTGNLSWYLFAYLGYLIMLPFLREIVVNISNEKAFLFIVIVSVFYAISGLTILIGHNPLNQLMVNVPIFYGGGLMEPGRLFIH